MSRLKPRDWVPLASEQYVGRLAAEFSGAGLSALDRRLHELVGQHEDIHARQCFNLNPATNEMNPRAEALQASSLGTRPSLGYPGDKYETGLEAMEQIEVLAAELAAEVFDADFAEVRVGSGALANLYAFMALTKPGDTIVAPPSTIGGHVTHHAAGCAGLYGLRTLDAPIDPDGFTVDVDALADLVERERPSLVTLGGSLNLYPHPVRAVREICDRFGARLMFDAAHQCGMIASRVWTNPLDEGADLMTMSTYKSLGGPAGGLVVTRDAALAQRLDEIAFPGMTANFDAGKTAALALTLMDWKAVGAAYGQAMVDCAQALAAALQEAGLPVHRGSRGATASHQFAIEAAPFGGGQAASKHLRQGGFLACGIGLPRPPVDGDLNGLRLGTPEIVRWGMTVADMPRLAGLIASALRSEYPHRLAAEVAAWRKQFDRVHFVR
ncbi:MAG: aminotransferase class I/II-fold pyridoxal phosphate-dependent enzyme [Burkholderiaceae bacterium]